MVKAVKARCRPFVSYSTMVEIPPTPPHPQGLYSWEDLNSASLGITTSLAVFQQLQRCSLLSSLLWKFSVSVIVSFTSVIIYLYVVPRTYDFVLMIMNVIDFEFFFSITYLTVYNRDRLYICIKWLKQQSSYHSNFWGQPLSRINNYDQKIAIHKNCT